MSAAFGTSYLNLCMDALVERLKHKLQIEVDSDNPTYAGLVRPGRLQNDTAIQFVSIVVHPKKHRLHLYNDYKVDAVPWEVGTPAGIWDEVFELEFSFFWRGDTDRELSRSKSHVVLSRARAAIMTMDAPRTTDDFGEGPFERHPIVVDAELQEGGGRGTFIWQGTMQVVFVTVVEPEEDE